MRDKKLKARTEGEKGRHLCPRLVQKLESRSVRKKKGKRTHSIGLCLRTSQMYDVYDCVESTEMVE